MIGYILIAILIFGFLIFIHESGHYLFARLFKVKINEFAIGMGPKLVSHTSKKTGIAYSLRMLPFGGFVSMAGEDGDSDDENAFFRKPVWQRIIITAAGAAVNIIVGLLVMAVIVVTSDKLASTRIAAFAENADFVTSEEQGLAVGDDILKIGKTRVYTGNDLQYEIMRQGDHPIDVTVLRDGEKIVVEDVEFPKIEESGTTFGARDFLVYAEEKTASSLAKRATVRSFSTIKMIYDSIFDLIRGRYGVEAVSGPVGVTQALGEAASEDTGALVYLAVVISVNLGVMNLLPLPALDGGRLLFQFIELVFRKPVPAKIEGYVHFAGMALLMLLLVVLTFKDVFALIR